MMDTYKTFEGKDKFFKNGGLKIENVKDFNYYTKILMYQYSKVDFIFRGVSEAKYKIYNSAQRLWFELMNQDDYYNEDKYDNFIISLMEECKKWNSKTIPNLLKTYEINDNNSVAYLSYMQHFELPTPFIDFTKNPNKALFFAIDSIPDEFVESDLEIENYFSVYYTCQNNKAYDIFRNVFDKNRENKNNGEFDYEDLTKNGIALISDIDKEFKILNNIRIVNQEGLFFYNNSPYQSIEELYKGFTDLLLEKFGPHKFKDMLVQKTFSGCFNFHKKYTNHIRQILSEMGINREYIYPKTEDLKEQMIKTAHNRIARPISKSEH